MSYIYLLSYYRSKDIHFGIHFMSIQEWLKKHRKYLTAHGCSFLFQVCKQSTGDLVCILITVVNGFFLYPRPSGGHGVAVLKQGF